MADLERNVSTTFSAIDAATRPLRSIESAMSHVGSTIGRVRPMMGPLTTALAGTDAATRPLRSIESAMSGVGSAIGGVGSLISPLTVALSALGTGLTLHGIVSLGQKAEDTRIMLAGFFSALGMTSDFNTGLVAAQVTMDKITTAAAKLPGEASQYIDMFRSGLPVVQQAVGGSLDQMIGFTNKYAAITSTLQIDSGQAARDLNYMLRSGTGAVAAHVQTFQRLLPFMHSVSGHASETAESFNQMNQQARSQLLQQTFAQLQPMLDASANTWTSMSGTTVSIVKMMAKMSTAPLFDAMKSGLGWVNNSLTDADGHFTRLGSTIVAIGAIISTEFVSAFEGVLGLVNRIGAAIGSLQTKAVLAPLVDSANRLIASAKSSVQIMLNQKIAPKDGVYAAMGSTAMGSTARVAPPDPAAAWLEKNIFAHAEAPRPVEFSMEAMSSASSGLASILNTLGSLLVPIAGLFSTLWNIVGSFVADVLPPLISGFAEILEPLGVFCSGIIALVDQILSDLVPAFNSIWESLGSLCKSLGEFIGPVLSILGTAVLSVCSVLTAVLMPAVRAVGFALGGIVKVISLVISALARPFKALAGAMGAIPAQPTAETPDVIGNVMARIDDKANSLGKIKVPTIELNKKPSPVPVSVPGGRGGGGVVQDFRYSRFDISQKFAEGYDPDRIVATFAHDIGRIGEQRLHSGFDPLFALR